MQKFLSIIAGMVMGLIVVVGVGYAAIHWLFKGTTDSSTTAVSAPVSKSGNNSIRTGNSDAGSQSNTSQAGAGSNNSALTSNETAAKSTGTGATSQSGVSNATAPGAANAAGTGATTTAQTGQALSVTQQNAMATAIQALLQNPTTEPVDSSAFVQYVYGKAGIKLPRTVAEQANVGARITSKGQLSYGDIVFFDLSTQQGTVTFDGIYIGNGQFVARTTHKIMSIGLDSSYWKNKFVFGQQAY